MGLLRLAALGALGFFGYKYYEKSRNQGPAAFDASQDPGENTTKVRDAGPEAMNDKPVREWSKEDQESDQSFPASDPPANY